MADKPEWTSPIVIENPGTDHESTWSPQPIEPGQDNSKVTVGGVSPDHAINPKDIDRISLAVIKEKQRTYPSTYNQNAAEQRVALDQDADNRQIAQNESRAVKAGRFKGIFQRAYALAVSQATRLSDKFRPQDENGERHLSKAGKVVVTVGALAVVAAGAVAAYKGFYTPSGRNVEMAGDMPSSDLGLEPLANTQPKSPDTSITELISESLTDLPTGVQDLNPQPDEMPWDTLTRSGFTDPGASLNNAAVKLQEATGTPFEWHNQGTNNAWIEVGGKSDTPSVLDQLKPYL